MSTNLIDTNVTISLLLYPTAIMIFHLHAICFDEECDIHSTILQEMISFLRRDRTIYQRNSFDVMMNAILIDKPQNYLIYLVKDQEYILTVVILVDFIS